MATSLSSFVHMLGTLDTAPEELNPVRVESALPFTLTHAAVAEDRAKDRSQSSFPVLGLGPRCDNDIG